MAIEFPIALDILGNSTRRQIISLLRYKPCNISEIETLLHLNPKVARDHIRYMEKNGFIASYEFYPECTNRKCYYLLNDVDIQIKYPDWTKKHSKTDILSVSDKIELYYHLRKSAGIISHELEDISTHLLELKRYFIEQYLIISEKNISSYGSAIITTPVEINILMAFLYTSPQESHGVKMSSCSHDNIQIRRTLQEIESATNYSHEEIDTACSSPLLKQYLIQATDGLILNLDAGNVEITNLLQKISTLTSQRKHQKSILKSVIHDIELLENSFYRMALNAQNDTLNIDDTDSNNLSEIITFLIHSANGFDKISDPEIQNALKDFPDSDCNNINTYGGSYGM